MCLWETFKFNSSGRADFFVRVRAQSRQQGRGVCELSLLGTGLREL